MAKKTIAEKKAALLAKRDVLIRKEKALDALIRRDKKKRADRIRFLLGSLVMNQAAKDPKFAALLAGVLDCDLIKPADRTLLASWLPKPAPKKTRSSKKMPASA